MSVLVAEHLSRSFGQGSMRTVVFQDVNFDLERGQFVLLMGPSGSGKSTLLALLGGLARPDSGKVFVLGQNLWQMTERQRERFRLKHFGFVFQGYNLFSALTAFEQLEMVLCWGERVTPREAGPRVWAILEELGLADKGHLRPAQLSGGEKQRVAIARALLKQPELCFADEPTAALDWHSGRQVVELLKEAARLHNTLMFIVSHDNRLVPFADRVFHLDDGLLVEAPPIPTTPGEGPS